MLLGIDLGTSNTLASTMSRDGVPILIPDAHNKNKLFTPSIICVEGTTTLIGEMAEQYFHVNPQASIFQFFKRSFGSSKPLHVDQDGKPWFSELMAAVMLKKVAFDAEVYIGESIDGVVITVPAHYSDLQRKSVIDAANIAGLNLLGIIEEPVAAAIHFSNNVRENEMSLIYDLGGGTFDITIITKVGTDFHVLAKDGLPSVGGKEFNDVIIHQIIKEYERLFSCQFQSKIWDLTELNRYSELIKLKFSENNRSLVNEWISIEGQSFEFVITRDEFTSGSQLLIDQTDKCIERCLKSVGIGFENIDKVILVGGGCLLPEIQSYWKSRTVSHKKELVFSEPFVSVAMGAAKYASTLQQTSGVIKQPLKLRSVSSFNLGVRYSNKEDQLDVLIQKNLPLPVTASRIIDLRKGEVIEAEVIQYWDLKDSSSALGIIKVDPLNADIRISINFENREDGTIGLKLKNVDTNKDVPFKFVKPIPKYAYQIEEQTNLINQTLINLIF